MAAHLKKRVYEQLSEVVQLPQEEAPAKKLRLTKPIPAALCPQLRGGRECGRGGTHTAGTLLQGVSGGVCVRDAQSVISDYFSNQDPRVRTAAIKAMSICRSVSQQSPEMLAAMSDKPNTTH
ncbi:integrator complex subunit 4-like isoform X3 [Oncorhynchus kisutch]|uniref:integrator complex subunit 4-like isoform X3 n=1 Tax=Oncorhynchus kisutch TaxID=8019 RepID=UPI0012DDED1F|nr:integrator complex subunit 4-like isoform X3 [Oncorhynchus kisutch]